MRKTQLFQNRFLAHLVTTLVMSAVVVSLGSFAIAQVGANSTRTNTSTMHEFTLLCKSTKSKTVAELKSPLRPNPKAELSRQINQFRAAVRKVFKREQVEKWEERLMLDQLHQTLRQEEIDLKLVDMVLDILNGNEPELKRQTFVLLKNSLESNRPLFWRQNQQLYIDEVEAAFDSLPELVADYLKTPDADHAEAISEILEYLIEMPKTANLIAMTRQMVVRPNLKVLANSDMITPFFLREIEEKVPVNDNILGTLVQGSGQLVGKTSASFVPSRDSAIIRVTFEGKLPTKTVGANGPVRVHSNNAATVTTVKDIVLTDQSIKTTRATTEVQHSSQITHVDYTWPGPVVRMMASNQIQNRKPASDAESKRLMKLRFNQRVDEEVDESMKSFTDYLNTTAKEWGGGKGLSVQIDRMATTYHQLMLKAVVGKKHQLTTLTEAPTVKTNAELLVQLHESLVHNVCADELSGKTLEEEQVIARLQERFPKLFENHEADETSEEPSLTISFSHQPVRMSFADNTIKLTVETTAIERGGNAYPGMTIEFQFRIEPIPGGFQLVAVEPPEVLPIGFNREEDQLSARETTIRVIIMKKLTRLTEKPIEWKEIAFEAKNGSMTLKPVHFSAANGWLSVGLNAAE